MSPLFGWKSQDERRREKVAQLAARARNDIDVGLGLRKHPWFLPVINSIAEHSRGFKLNPSRASEQLEKQIGQMSKQVVDYVVNQLEAMPDAETKLERLLRPSWIDSNFVRSIQGELQVVGLGEFVVQMMSNFHEDWTGTPFTAQLAGLPLDKEWV